MKNKQVFVSFLITHYNRPSDLLKCVEAIKRINLDSYEIVVSDDCSSADNIKLFQNVDVDKIIYTEKNQGLASNINKGLKACQGKYIIYCQEDFLLNPEIINVLQECVELLDEGKADMVRFRANYEFKKLIRLTKNVNLIPKFSFRNILVNSFQYSDNPFITTKEFFRRYGYYMDGTSGDFGETEYATRIFKSNAKIAIVPNQYVCSVLGSNSVIDREKTKGRRFYGKFLRQIIRAFRLHFECAFYNDKTRGLLTYRNYRNK